MVPVRSLSRLRLNTMSLFSRKLKASVYWLNLRQKIRDEVHVSRAVDSGKGLMKTDGILMRQKRKEVG